MNIQKLFLVTLMSISLVGYNLQAADKAQPEQKQKSFFTKLRKNTKGWFEFQRARSEIGQLGQEIEALKQDCDNLKNHNSNDPDERYFQNPERKASDYFLTKISYNALKYEKLGILDSVLDEFFEKTKIPVTIILDKHLPDFYNDAFLERAKSLPAIKKFRSDKLVFNKLVQRRGDPQIDLYKMECVNELNRLSKNPKSIARFFKETGLNPNSHVRGMISDMFNRDHRSPYTILDLTLDIASISSLAAAFAGQDAVDKISAYQSLLAEMLNYVDDKDSILALKEKEFKEKCVACLRKDKKLSEKKIMTSEEAAEFMFHRLDLLDQADCKIFRIFENRIKKGGRPEDLKI